MTMIEEIKRKIDIDIAQIVHDPEKDGKKLKINNDTEYRIFYDVYNAEDEKYFYIKMIEVTADAPFYYIRSYKIDELHQLNKIFKVFDNDNFEIIKRYMNTLFKENKISLSFEQNEDIIKMELDVILFANKEKISFELYREMIPDEEKDSKLLDLYSSEKEKNKKIKQILSLINNNFKDNKDKEIIENLKKILKSKKIPGIEDEEIKIDNPIIMNKPGEPDNVKIGEKIVIKKKDDEDIYNTDDIGASILTEKKNDITSKIFKNIQKRYLFSLSSNESLKCFLNAKNIFEKSWQVGALKLVLNEKLSTLKFSKIEEPYYEIEKGQDGDFVVEFYKKDLKKGKYKCALQLFDDGEKLTDSDVLLNIKIKD